MRRFTWKRHNRLRRFSNVIESMTFRERHWPSEYATSDQTWQVWPGKIVTKWKRRSPNSARSISVVYLGRAYQFRPFYSWPLGFFCPFVSWALSFFRPFILGLELFQPGPISGILFLGLRIFQLIHLGPNYFNEMGWPVCTGLFFLGYGLFWSIYLLGFISIFSLFLVCLISGLWPFHFWALAFSTFGPSPFCLLALAFFAFGPWPFTWTLFCQQILVIAFCSPEFNQIHRSSNKQQISQDFGQTANCIINNLTANFDQVHIPGIQHYIKFTKCIYQEFSITSSSPNQTSA
jgi:hypothetical protein